MIRYPRAYNYFVRFLIFAHFVTGVLYIMWIGQVCSRCVRQVMTWTSF